MDNAIWQDPDFIALSADARYLYLWSFTNPRCNMAGLYKLALPPIPAETGMTLERINEALRALDEAAFAYYREGVLWVRSRVAYLRSKSPNMAKSIASDIEKIGANHPLALAFLEHYGQVAWLRNALREIAAIEPKMERVPQPSRNPSEGFQGKGMGKEVSSSVEVVEVEEPTAAELRDAEWNEWLSHYRAVTGRGSVKGSAEARRSFNARRADFSLGDLKAATEGCHADDYLRSRKFDRPETILRASNVERYIALAREPKESSSPGMRNAHRLARMAADAQAAEAAQ